MRSEICARRLLASAGACAAGAALACASVHALPSPPPPKGASLLPLRLEVARLGVFKSEQADVEVERVFVSTVSPRTVLVTSAAPRAGVYATGDGGLTWSFAEVDLDDETDGPRDGTGGTARLFRDVLFDPRAPGRIFALTRQRLVRSEDSGATWSVCPLESSGARPGQIDAAAITGAALLVASGPFLYSSDDEGRTWSRRPVRVDGVEQDQRVRVRSIAVDQADPRRLMIALHAVTDGPDLARRIGEVIDGTSELGLAALALVDHRDPERRQISLGSGPAGVLVSTDGGLEWRRSGLGLDAWLVARRGVVYALAADPLLEAAVLARQHPGLADALRQQLHGLRFDIDSLRSAFEYPGLDRLLLGPMASAPLFRSNDGGLTWSRVLAPEAATLVGLRASIDRQRGVWLESPRRGIGGNFARVHEAGGGPEGGGAPPGGQGEGRGMGGGRIGGGRMGGGRMGGGRRGGTRGGGTAPRQSPPLAREVSAEAMLTYLDPLRLLSRYNADRPLSGVATASGQELLGWVPTQAQWSRLAEAAISATDAAGEISLGPGYPGNDLPPDGRFALLRSIDDGRRWESAGPLASDFHIPKGDGQLQPDYPASISSSDGELILVLGAFDREHRASRKAWRWLEPAAR